MPMRYLNPSLRILMLCCLLITCGMMSCTESRIPKEDKEQAEKLQKAIEERVNRINKESEELNEAIEKLLNDH